MDYRITVDRKMCLIADRPTGRRIGTGIRRRGLWYMDREELGQTGSPVFAAIVEERESVAMKHHCRMGHVSFDKMFKLFPDVMHGVDKNKLKCDACEFAKHTRTSYVRDLEVYPHSCLFTRMCGQVRWCRLVVQSIL